MDKSTESTFTEDFWNSLDLVATALDNVAGRVYVDAKCVLYRKTLLESGTLGTKGNVQVVVPHLTQSYGDSTDPPEKSVPMCTERFFPAKVEHILFWANQRFGYFFCETVETVKDLATGDREEELDHAEVDVVNDFLAGGNKADPFRSPMGCLEWARFTFERLFSNDIKQLLTNFPADSLTSSGQPFWSPPKRCPRPISFDAADVLHLQFVISAARLRARTIGLKEEMHDFLTANDFSLATVVGNIQVAPFFPRDGVSSDSDISNGNSPFVLLFALFIAWHRASTIFCL
jgi:ubiquitin-activating enzyme E1